MDTLILKAELTNPPTEPLAFRALTLLAVSSLQLYCLVEVEVQSKDIYYRYMKQKDLMDYVEQLITPPEQEQGIRIDTDYNIDPTVCADRITFSNVPSLLGRVATYVS